MPTARRLLGLYPRRWRERYGEEFLALAGDGALRPQVVFDIVMGAIDAWLSADVRRTTVGMTATGGGAMLRALWMCERNAGARVTPRDGLIGAGVMLAATVIFSLAGIAARRAGWTATGETVKSLAFLGPFVVSMPFWLMEGQPLKAQAAIIGVTLTILVASGYLSTLL